jgi:hypothetical protein
MAAVTTDTVDTDPITTVDLAVMGDLGMGELRQDFMAAAVGTHPHRTAAAAGAGPHRPRVVLAAWGA